MADFGFHSKSEVRCSYLLTDLRQHPAEEGIGKSGVHTCEAHRHDLSSVPLGSHFHAARGFWSLAACTETNGFRAWVCVRAELDTHLADCYAVFVECMQHIDCCELRLTWIWRGWRAHSGSNRGLVALQAAALLSYVYTCICTCTLGPCPDTHLKFYMCDVGPHADRFLMECWVDVKLAVSCFITWRAHPDLNQGPADLQSAALTTELCTHVNMLIELAVVAAL